MEERRRNNHSISMENREMLNITGVIDVISFDEEIVVTETEDGVLIIRGFDLHVSNLNLDGGHLSVDGSIYSINYDDTKAEKNSSFLKKIFK
ncbi:MAG: sporulation protein YabP [Lachnospirales bacterium]